MEEITTGNNVDYIRGASTENALEMWERERSMREELISVIIPTYNRRDKVTYAVKKCFRSDLFKYRSNYYR